MEWPEGVGNVRNMDENAGNQGGTGGKAENGS